MKPEISIVIPAYNESDRLIAPLHKLLDFAEAAGNIEIVIVDDGSSDRTAEIARKTAAEKPAVSVNVIRYEKNRGKGFAVKTGLIAATADIALTPTLIFRRRSRR
ncbi:MAG: glycosyltransferase [Acidobacteria bacterium]|nr:glycosyltransferase [Acidobacteriota bacterium]